MLEQGLIVETSERPAPDMDDERRRYYRMTPFGAVLLGLRDSETRMAALGYSPFAYRTAGLMTTRKYIAARPDIVRRVVKSIVEGAAVVRKDPETAKRALSIRMRIKDPKDLEETYQQLRGFTQVKPYPSLEGFKAILNDLSKRVPAAKNADPKDFADLRFIEELDKSGYIDSLQ